MKSLSSRLLNKHRGRTRAPDLGEREMEVMKILWLGEPVSAQQVLQSCSGNTLSLSTVQSTLERLSRKQLASRIETGRHYLYQAAISRDEIISQLMGNISEQLSDGDMAPMISGFMSFIDQETPGQLTDEMKATLQGLPTGHKQNE